MGLDDDVNSWSRPLHGKAEDDNVFTVAPNTDSRLQACKVQQCPVQCCPLVGQRYKRIIIKQISHVHLSYGLYLTGCTASA